MKLFLLFFLPFVSPVRHTVKYFLTATSGIPNFPEFVGVALVDDFQLGYCDSNIKRAEPKPEDWVKELFKDNPQHQQWYTGECYRHELGFRDHLDTLRQRFNQSEGVHTYQRMDGCEWDDETGEVKGFLQYSYDGEDFLVLDLNTLTWIAPVPQAVPTKLSWDADEATRNYNKIFYMHTCPDDLKLFLKYGNSSLQRTDLLSVSLLQKSPSSPVCCHATGFYPDQADIFWRKEGQQLYEDVDHGELLPNHDGTFQLSVDLDLSSVKPEDWGKYECVFQLAGVKDDIITKLDKDTIRTNHETPSDVLVPVSAAVAVLALVLAAIIGFIVYKKKKGAKCPPSPDSSSEASQHLNPDATTT